MGSRQSISVQVALYASLRKYHPERPDAGPVWLDVPAGTTVDGLLELLGMPPSEVKQAFVDNRQREGGYVIRDGERVAVFPPIAGG